MPALDQDYLAQYLRISYLISIGRNMGEENNRESEHFESTLRAHGIDGLRDDAACLILAIGDIRCY